MSLLGDLAKSALGNVIGGQKPQQPADPKAQMLNMAVSLLTSQGGIDGLMSKFNSAGLGGMMSQWISTGPNPPATGDQIKKVLGKDQLEGLAKESGQSSSAVADGIAQILPGLIDKLTPNGQSVQGDLLQAGLQAALKGGLGKMFG